MEAFNLIKKRRLPVTLAALLLGVACAGLMSSFIESPQGENEYLHEHLSAVGEQKSYAWSESTFDLPAKDKLKVANIIAKSEQASVDIELKEILAGQALKVTQDNICSGQGEACRLPIRLNRELSVAHLHRDMRVANIKEKSRRVDLQIFPDGKAMQISGIYDEVRVLRFYQTQAGWVQNMAATIQSDTLAFIGREDRFQKRFASSFTGLNYYPASASWADFWTEFPAAQIKADIAKAKALNVNALRIFITHDYFDDAQTREEGLRKLRAFLDICAENDIQALVTLFDLRPDYTLSNWEADIAHIDYILEQLGQHKAILGIDLKNQADLDFDDWGEGRVEAWLTVMARHIQTSYPELPVTTGWSHADNALRLKDVFDFVTYHEYQNPRGFAERLGVIETAVQGKPIMITELGSTIWQPPFIRSFGEKSQARRLGKQLGQAAQAKGVFVWTLNDFDHVGSEVVGPLPWRKAQQRHFGLIRPDGTLRPAAKILKDFGARPLAKASHKNAQLQHTKPY